MRRTVLKAMLTIALIIALPACKQRTAGDDAASAPAEGPVKGVDRSHKGKPAPAAAFHDPVGKDISLAAFNGRPVLVNLWASWCAPCVKELPTLDRLARAHSGLQVVAISADSTSSASVVAFLKVNRVATLAPYHDPAMAMSGALGAEVLPTSVLFDAHGREVWRYVGELDWTGAEAARLLGEGGAR